MKSFLKFSFLILAISFTAKAYASGTPTTSTVPPRAVAPEIDPGLAISGLALLGGALTVARAKRLKK
jgi:hypothetical protein